jgi:hypothetical protein
MATARIGRSARGTTLQQRTAAVSGHGGCVWLTRECLEVYLYTQIQVSSKVHVVLPAFWVATNAKRP